MPKLAVLKAFATRGITTATASPLDMYRVASLFGVGYATLVQHLTRTLSVLSGSRAAELLKTTPKKIREQILGASTAGALHLVDSKWADGGRAAVIEEGVSALVYAYARARDFLDGATEVDHDIIDMLRKMTSHLEVRARTDAEWAKAILVGFNVWRQVRKDNGGHDRRSREAGSFLRQRPDAEKGRHFEDDEAEEDAQATRTAHRGEREAVRRSTRPRSK